MTKVEIDAVLERVKTWPHERQEDAARTLMLMEETGIYKLEEREIVAILAAFDEERRTGLASGDRVRSIFRRLN